MIESRRLNKVRQFRYVGITEAISFLILIGIAMPLKYFYNIPEAVKFFGWVHGVLFVAYLAQLMYLSNQLRWDIGRVSVYFLAALLPFAPFYVDQKLRREYN